MNNLLTRIEAADIAVADATAPVEATSVGRLVDTIGALGDQPPLRILCGTLIVAGAAIGDRRLASAGFQMIAAHTAATVVKSFVKDHVDRTRPSLLIARGEYEARPGESSEHDRTSFPSGHAAGVAAVGGVFASAYPQHRRAALAAAALVAIIQVPRRAHFVSDIVAGGLIGLVSAAAVEQVWRRTGLAGAQGDRTVRAAARVNERRSRSDR